MHPNSETAKAIPVDTGGEESYQGTDRPVQTDPPAPRIRLATADRGGFDFWLISAAQARALGIGLVTVEAYSVHVCSAKPSR